MSWLGVDGRGFLWVLTGRGAREATAGVIGTCDVFDAEGRYLQAVTLQGRGDTDDDRFILRDDRLFVLTQYASAYRLMLGNRPAGGDGGDATEPMSVICYAMSWAPPGGD
ncbi:MAG: hypothetical protein GF355_07480 [Candidatus Eisenbacteria bacterium]|nr:hypothetical protein [Candidatus Eisenbacteria bacterium]